MFTGIVQSTATLTVMERIEGRFFICIKPKKKIGSVRHGDSISVNGVCLTVIRSFKNNIFRFEVMPETLRKTTFNFLCEGDIVNYEPALRLGDRLGGHMVYGHIDGIGEVFSVERDVETTLVTVRIPKNFARYAILHGSIACDGISLTIARIKKNLITVSLTEETLKRIGWNSIAVGKKVNIEVDAIAKYVESFM